MTKATFFKSYSTGEWHTNISKDEIFEMEGNLAHELLRVINGLQFEIKQLTGDLNNADRLADTYLAERNNYYAVLQANGWVST